MSNSFNEKLTPEQEASSATTSPERLRELAQQSRELRLLVAQNRHTPSELLVELDAKYRYWVNRAYDKCVKNDDPDLSRLIAANPNTPPNVLQELIKDFPQEVIDNPIFELLLLENLNFIADIPYQSLERLLDIKLLPPFVLAAVLKHKNICWLIANVSSQCLLEMLAHDVDVKIRCQVAKNSNTPTTSLEMLTHDVDVKIRRHVAFNANTPTTCLEILAYDADRQVRWQVANNPNTSTTSLEMLVCDADPEIHRYVLCYSKLGYTL